MSAYVEITKEMRKRLRDEMKFRSVSAIGRDICVGAKTLSNVAAGANWRITRETALRILSIPERKRRDDAQNCAMTCEQFRAMTNRKEFVALLRRRCLNYDALEPEIRRRRRENA